MAVFYEQLEWDSKQLDLKCGLIGLRNVSSNVNQNELADTIIQTIGRNRDTDFITIKLPGDFPIVLNCLLKNSVRFIDTELVYRFAHFSDINDEYTVNFFDSFDPNIFIPLADEMIFSRFYRDDRIRRDAARRLWVDSIRNHCMGRADRLAVVFVQKQPVGMATINFRDNKVINLHIVGVLKPFQGRGVGSSLISKITREYGGKYEIYTETQSLNKGARMLYQHAGFFLNSIQYVLHVWP